MERERAFSQLLDDVTQAWLDARVDVMMCDSPTQTDSEDEECGRNPFAEEERSPVKEEKKAVTKVLNGAAEKFTENSAKNDRELDRPVEEQRECDKGQHEESDDTEKETDAEWWHRITKEIGAD